MLSVRVVHLVDRGLLPRRSARIARRVTIAAVCAASCFGLVGCNMSPGPEDDAALSNDEQIRGLMDGIYQSLRDEDYERFNRLQCAKYRSPATGEPDKSSAAVLRGAVLDSVDSIVVKGDTATAVTRHHMSNDPEKFYTNTITLKLEDGLWTLC